jgi:hypothetical protein
VSHFWGSLHPVTGFPRLPPSRLPRLPSRPSSSAGF